MIQNKQVENGFKIKDGKKYKSNDKRISVSRNPSHLHIVMSFDSGWNKQRS